mmetsp:Transcript_4616/g.20708  ORF Transcript_4616/g.20708 Transcript_4616/m.20708 type:complete len:282 (-) Transcript_4616:195-1040(-)
MSVELIHRFSRSRRDVILAELLVEAEQGRVGDPSSRDGAPRRDTFASVVGSIRWGDDVDDLPSALGEKVQSRRRRRVGEERRQERAPRDDAFVRVVRSVHREGPGLGGEPRVTPRVIPPPRVVPPHPFVDVRSQRTSEGVGAPVGVGRDQARGRREQLRRPGPPEGVEQDASDGGERGSLGATRGCRRAAAVAKQRGEARSRGDLGDGRVAAGSYELRQQRQCLPLRRADFSAVRIRIWVWANNAADGIRERLLDVAPVLAEDHAGLHRGVQREDATRQVN